MGWENVFHCEWNEFGQKVLRHYWPDAELFTDITKSNFSKYHGTIDIISGGFPCQPYSMAGKRLGKEDARHLWPEMLRVIREVRPRWVVGENVLGLVNWNGGLVFDEVQNDLEAEGYEVQPYVLPAAAVDAPHRRDRVWFVAYRNLHGRNECNCGHEEQSGERGVDAQRDIMQGICDGDAADARLQRQAERQQQPMGFEQLCQKWDASDSKGKRSRQFASKNSGGPDGRFDKACKDGDAADSDGIGGWKTIGQREGKSNVSDKVSTANDDANTNGIGSIHGNGQNKPNISKTYGFEAFCSAGGWETFPTQSPICSRDDGLSTELDGITFSKWRNESIKAYGNAVVPQVVYQIFKAIEAYESQ
jgi:DNA (cytosine-5)-methyltransferase 1